MAKSPFLNFLSVGSKKIFNRSTRVRLIKLMDEYLFEIERPKADPSMEKAQEQAVKS